MELKVKYSGRFRRELRLALKRGLDISLLEEIVEKLREWHSMGRFGILYSSK